MNLISDRVSMALTGIYGMCFAGNSLADNILTQVKTYFHMPRTANIIHYSIAHKYPDMADLIGDYCSKRGFAVGRPAVQANMEVYDKDVLVVFKKILDFNISLEKEIYSVMNLAEAENDKQTVRFLDEFLGEVLDLIDICNNVVGYIEDAGNSKEKWIFIDSNINKFLNIKFQQ